MNQDRKSSPPAPEVHSLASAQDPRRIDPILRKKYDVRGPRYTSYPPATHFHPLPGDDLFDRWRKSNDAPETPGLSLYLHIPFCRRRCLFCGCHTKVGKNTEAVIAYVEAMQSEMALAADIIDTSRPVHQVSLGGGTPNFLPPPLLDSLLSGLEQRWNIADGAECSAEIDPRLATKESLGIFLNHGFNRFSLGIQDFSKEVLGKVRPGQELMDAEEVVAFLGSRRIRHINFDLIYGLPGQSLESADQCASQVIQLKPSRIALYSYAHVPWIHPHQKALEKAGLPHPDLKSALFLTMMDRFLTAGYLHIGMDHFALPEDPLAQAAKARTLRRNFMGYTTGRGLDLLAFGASAISSLGTSYSQNQKGLTPYREDIGKGILPVARGYLLDDDDVIRRELLLELFCNSRVDLKGLSRQFGIDILKYFAAELRGLEPLAEDGLLHMSPRAIEVTEVGRFFIRNICMKFDRYLEKEASARVYSRTV